MKRCSGYFIVVPIALAIAAAAFAGPESPDQGARTGAIRLALDTVTSPKPTVQSTTHRDLPKNPQSNLPAKPKKKFWCEEDCAPARSKSMERSQSKQAF